MAGRIPEEFINEVRSNVNIVDFISQYVSLEKKGKDYFGLCPFHQERTPSFTVNEEKQFFKCFSCGRGGNVFKFLMDKEGLTFPESVKRVAEFAHIPMPANYGKSHAVSNPLFKIQQAAAFFYNHVLTATRAGERGMNYAHQRKLSPEIIKHFEIGYAPKQDNLLLTYLHGKKYTDEDLLKSGLFVQSKEGRLFDRFRDRLIFPLTNESGQIVGFSGRRVSKDQKIAKYMNSPETEIFTKSKVLFHFAEAKRAVRQEGHLVLYEGYMDVISAYKAGVHAGIASMGTSLTDEQVYLLRRVTRNVIINYDGDDPGVHAEERAARMFQRAGGFNLGIVVLPEKLDPDEYVKKYGKEKYLAEVRGALSPTDFFLQRLAHKYNLNNDRERIAYLSEAVKEIARLANPVEQDLYLAKVAKQQGITQDSLKANLIRERRRLNRVRRHTATAVEPSEPVPLESTAAASKKSQFDPAQTRLLYLFIHSAQVRDYLLSSKFLFPDKDYAELQELWLNFTQTHENESVNSFLDFIPERLQSIIVNAEMTEMPQESSLREVKEIIHAIKIRQINSQLNKLKEQIEDAKRKDDGAEIMDATQKILQLKRIQGQREAF